MSTHESFKRPKLTEEEFTELKADMGSQLHNILGVTISRCETAEELFELKDLLIALNGLTRSTKGTNA